MANFWTGEDFVAVTNQLPVICDPTTTTSHGIEEPFSFPKISNVWSINNPTNQLTPQSVVVEGEMEGGDEAPEQEPLPLPPLRLKVQLPSRASFLVNGVHHLELVLLYGHLEEHVLMIDIHGPMMELPIPKQEEEPEIPISDNSSVPINSFPYSHPSPISNHGDEGVVEELLDDLAPSPRKKKITPRRRRKMTQSTACQICHKKFSDKSTAAQHSFLHLSQGKNQCYFCSKRFQSPSKLDIHLLVHTREKPHPCDKCNRKFNHKSHLNTHLRLHNPANPPLFHCEECDKSFSRNEHLTRHVTTVHLRLKPFQCPECGQKFGQKNSMTTHLNGFHLGIRYPCRKPNCDKSFSDTSHLRRHEKKAH